MSNLLVSKLCTWFLVQDYCDGGTLDDKIIEAGQVW